MYRPKTRGELVSKLKEGITCEVLNEAVDMTETMIQGWLGFRSYKTEPSENKGWTVFVPKLYGGES